MTQTNRKITDFEQESYLNDLSILLLDMKSSYEKLHSEQAKKLWVRIVERLLRYSNGGIKGYSINAEKVIREDEFGYKGDLKDLEWKHQPKYDPGRKKIFCEHVYPLTLLAKRFLDGKIDVEICINNRFCVWITADENNSLNIKGYRNERPEGWEKCYRDCGIELKFHK